MANKNRELRESLQLRNAAKRLLRADLRAITGDEQEEGLVERVKEDMSGRAASLGRKARKAASKHPVKLGTGIALGVGVCVAWMFRDRILEAAQRLARAEDARSEWYEDDDEEAELDADFSRSDDD